MSRLYRAGRLTPITALIALSSAGFSAAAPTAADFAHCAAITAPDARLACYDALTRSPPAIPAPASGTATAPAAATAPAGAPPPAATPAATPAAAGASATVGASPAAPQPPSPLSRDPRNFGFTEAQVQAQTQAHAPPEGLTKIQAHVAKFIESSRTGQSLVVLDNGQAWMFVDPDDNGGPRPGDLVTIKRASLGSFLMQTPSKHSYHVRRTK